ncbi:Crp/Fnr family transcriptional regulator [Treponema sp. OMZ 840]|uniref:Crp/Fnr family transcriptional regulator n=1 Tax=Treponema sp. OMZ 840 TaxID=244313 RepID=UPI003D8CC5DB
MLQLSFVNFRKDSYLLVEGKAENDRFFIIQSGKVRTFRQSEVLSDAASVLGPGDFVGVVPCMSSHSQIETAVAVTDVIAISVRRDQYQALISKNTPVAMKIIRTFATRMRTVNEILTRLTLKNTVADSPEQMYSIAAYYEKMGKTDLAVYGYYQYMKECPGGINIEKAKSRFVTLKARSHAVYFESPTGNLRNYPKDTMIFSECQSGQDMFIIQSGQVKISKVVDDNEVILAVLQKGDFFGEMALLENKPRSASAIAHEDCTLMAVNRKNFDQMVATQSQLITRLTITLAERLWSMSRQLTNAQLRDPMFKLFDMLALQLEKNRVPLGKGASHQFDLTPYDLANMCGIPQEEQAIILAQFIKDPRVRLVGNKIYISDCRELMKAAEFYRKQKHSAPVL